MTVWKCATVGCFNTVTEKGERCAECRDNRRLIPDGGTETQSKSEEVRDLIREKPCIDDQEYVGIGAFAGMVSGSALGAGFGPVGMVVGGLAGFFVGNEVEYQALKNDSAKRGGRR